MGQRISGTGVGLQAASYLYPSELNPSNTPLDLGSNYQTLGPGDIIAIPAGQWYIAPGPYCSVQYLDPITGVWRNVNSSLSKIKYVISDGFNYRVANLTGCPVAAVVTAGGSAYPASTTVTSSSGGSTWQAIVGGMVSVSTINNAGSGYGIPPQLFIAAPPSPGVQASGYCTLQSGTVSAVTLTNVGGGYVTAPAAVVVTNPFDPNLSGGSIKAATVTLAVVGSGSIAAVLCTNPGASIASAPTLTIAGTGGSGATVTALRLQTFVSATVASAGTWTGGAYMTTIGGGAGQTEAFANPAVDESGFIPRPAQVLLSGASSTLASVATLVDGGLFLSAPTVVVLPVSGNISPASTATISATYGGVADTVLIQPAP